MRVARPGLPWFSKPEDPCPLCRASSDRIEHLLGECLFYQVAWREWRWRIWDCTIFGESPYEIISFFLSISHIFCLADWECSPVPIICCNIALYVMEFEEQDNSWRFSNWFVELSWYFRQFISRTLENPPEGIWTTPSHWAKRSELLVYRYWGHKDLYGCIIKSFRNLCSKCCKERKWRSSVLIPEECSHLSFAGWGWSFWASSLGGHFQRLERSPLPLWFTPTYWSHTDRTKCPLGD